MENVVEKKKKAYVAFTDLENAYDSEQESSLGSYDSYLVYMKNLNFKSSCSAYSVL